MTIYPVDPWTIVSASALALAWSLVVLKALV